MAIEGSLLGPILYFVIAFGCEMALRYGLMYWSYNMGTKAVTMMTGFIIQKDDREKIIYCLCILSNDIPRYRYKRCIAACPDTED